MKLKEQNNYDNVIRKFNLLKDTSEGIDQLTAQAKSIAKELARDSTFSLLAEQEEIAIVEKFTALTTEA